MRIIQSVNGVDELVITTNLNRTVYETNPIYFGERVAGDINGDNFEIQYEKCTVKVEVLKPAVDPIVERLKI